MAVTTSPRLGLTRWSAATDPFTRAQMDSAMATIDQYVAVLNKENTFNQETVTAVPIRVKAIASATGNLAEFQTDTGVLATAVDVTGAFTNPGGGYVMHPTNSVQNSFVSKATGNVAFQIKAAATQTSVLARVRNGADETTLSIFPSGTLATGARLVAGDATGVAGFTSSALVVNGISTSQPTVAIVPAASQTSNLTEWWSNGTLRTSLNVQGGIETNQQVFHGVDSGESAMTSGASTGSDGVAYRYGILYLRNRNNTTVRPILGRIMGQGFDSLGNNTTYTDLRSTLRDATDGSEDGVFQFFSMTNGSLREAMVVGDVGAGYNVIIPGLADTAARSLVVRGTTNNTVGIFEVQSGNTNPRFSVFDASSTVGPAVISIGTAVNNITHSLHNGNADGTNATAVLRFRGDTVVHGDVSFVPGTTDTYRFQETSNAFGLTNTYSTVRVGTLRYGTLTAVSAGALKESIEPLDVTSEPKTKLQRRAASHPAEAQRESNVPPKRTEPLLQRLKEARPVTFHFKDEDPNVHPLHYGFVAEELAMALPEVATYDKVRNYEGTVDPETGKMVKNAAALETTGAINGYDLNSLVTLVVASMQNLLTRVEALEGRTPPSPTPTRP